MSDVIAITGASGFIGRSIARQLRAQGWRLRLLLRSGSAVAAFESLDAEVVRGDLDDARALSQLVQGASAVVHCAGVVRGARQRDFDRVNVDGLAHLLEALRASSPAPRLLALSSLAAREPGLSFYADSKRRGEQLLQREAQALDWLALRPPAVYGPGDREMLPLFRAMARGFAPVPGSTSARFSMIHVDDLARAVVAWLRQPGALSGVVTLHDGRGGGYDWTEVCETVAELCRRRVRPLRIPAPLLDVPAWLNARLSPLLGRAPMLTTQKLRELRHPDWVCDNAVIGARLDWRPRLRLREGLLETPGWCPLLDRR